MDLSEEWKKIEKSHESDSQELLKLLPSTNDLTLITLKGHLVVEARLNQIIDSYCHHPEHLKDIRLSFSQRVHLVRALVPLPEKICCFKQILDLNRLRNKLAHELSPEDVDRHVAKFVKNSIMPKTAEKLSSLKKDPPLDKQVRLAIVYVLGRLQVIGAVSELMDKTMPKKMLFKKSNLPE